MRLDLPPLAQYKPRSEYVPQYGDYIVFSKWFSTWHGLVTNYDANNGELYIVFAGVPFLLFTMQDAELEKETKKIKLSDIKGAANGKYAILQHNQPRNAIIWYI
jgi:hypothetical protein